MSRARSIRPGLSEEAAIITASAPKPSVNSITFSTGFTEVLLNAKTPLDLASSTLLSFMSKPTTFKL